MGGANNQRQISPRGGVATSTDCGGAAIVPQGIHWCVGSYFRLVEWCLHGWQLAFNCRSFLLLHRCSSLRCRAHVSRWWNRGQQVVAPLAARQEASVWQSQDGSLAHNSAPRADGSARAARERLAVQVDSPHSHRIPSCSTRACAACPQPIARLRFRLGQRAARARAACRQR